MLNWQTSWLVPKCRFPLDKFISTGTSLISAVPIKCIKTCSTMYRGQVRHYDKWTKVLLFIKESMSLEYVLNIFNTMQPYATEKPTFDHNRQTGLLLRSKFNKGPLHGPSKSLQTTTRWNGRHVNRFQWQVDYWCNSLWRSWWRVNFVISHSKYWTTEPNSSW